MNCWQKTASWPTSFRCKWLKLSDETISMVSISWFITKFIRFVWWALKTSSFCSDYFTYYNVVLVYTGNHSLFTVSPLFFPFESPHPFIFLSRSTCSIIDTHLARCTTSLHLFSAKLCQTSSQIIGTPLENKYIHVIHVSVNKYMYTM